MNLELVISGGVICLIAWAIVALGLALEWKKRKRINLQWGNRIEATKYCGTTFDRTSGLAIIQVDLYFTQLNNCPIVFRSSDGKTIVVNIHFRYMISKSQLTSNKTFKNVELRAHVILTEELKKLTKGFHSNDINGCSFDHIRSIKPIFKRRMGAYVNNVEHLFLIGTMRVLNSPHPYYLSTIELN